MRHPCEQSPLQELPQTSLGCQGKRPHLDPVLRSGGSRQGGCPVKELPEVGCCLRELPDPAPRPLRLATALLWHDLQQSEGIQKRALHLQVFFNVLQTNNNLSAWMTYAKVKVFGLLQLSVMFGLTCYVYYYTEKYLYTYMLYRNIKGYTLF